MAKSTYLDNLINDRLPKNNSRYLSSLWDTYGDNTYTTYRFNTLNNFTNEEFVTVMGSDYLNNINTNQTVLNMNDPALARITLNTEYLPINRISRNMQNTLQNVENTLRYPAEYLPARITSIKGNSVVSIPILFPASFSRSLSASFAKENPIGSDKPIMAYSYTDAEEIPFEFDALADYLPAGFNSLKSYVGAILDILRPGKSGNIVQEPTVQVLFADMSFKGVCTSISVAYDNLFNNKSFVHAKISCQFTKLD